MKTFGCFILECGGGGGGVCDIWSVCHICILYACACTPVVTCGVQSLTPGCFLQISSYSLLRQSFSLNLEVDISTVLVGQ